MKRFEEAFDQCCAKAAEIYPQFIKPTLDFSLRGQAAGWAHGKPTEGWWHVRLNKTYCLAEPLDMLEDTIPHEVAHILARQRYGNVKVHGKEWVAMFGALTGRVPSRCHDYEHIDQARRTVEARMANAAEDLLRSLEKDA